MKYLYGAIAGGLLVTILATKLMLNYIDTNKRTNINTLTNAYFLGCVEAGDSAVNCHIKSFVFIEPLEKILDF